MKSKKITIDALDRFKVRRVSGGLHITFYEKAKNLKDIEEGDLIELWLASFHYPVKIEAISALPDDSNQLLKVQAFQPLL